MIRHIEVLEQVPEVEGTHTVTGQFDLLDNVRVPGPEHVPHIPVFTISALPTLRRTETMLALVTHQEGAPVGVTRPLVSRQD